MAVTRAKATSLLNKTEMGLYDASRANAVRGLSDAQLAKLVTRARTARDRARDLEKRQRLASRKSTGSKTGRTGQANARTGEKAELLADILGRLETRQKDNAKAAKAATTAARKSAKKTSATGARKPAAKSAAAASTAGTRTKSVKSAKTSKAAKAASKTSATSATSRRAASATTSTSVGKTTAKPVSARSRKTATARTPDAADKPAAPARKSRRGTRISPERALDNTRQLLEQHEAQARTPKPWEEIGHDGAAPATPGFQSPQARAKALELHAAESRQASINGSSSTRDRKNQGKRDRRAATD
ncbi:hypothetical protein [Luteimonas sp. RC10]|uniref:hypothetical protein n=1 Tax=Luteimonas sp. RC10 TaxID=2587035 RepID=UPI001614824D|nr:hypothetical protein [Luteimonas sp. RC10]MBB3342938.1 hypothetical protein [Luteimonas sp. RC10]